MRVKRYVRAARHPYTEYQVQKAKKEHRKKFPYCTVCGIGSTFFRRNNDVHHEVPVHVDPSRACDPDNLVTMCRLHHWIVGHLRYWKDWNKELRWTIIAIREVFTKVAKSALDRTWLDR